MKIVLCVALLASTFVVEGKRFAGLGYRSLDKLARSDRAAARNMPVELFSSDVGALDFSGPALDSGAVDGRYWFFSQAAPVLTTNNKVDFLSKKTAGKDRKKKTEKTEKRMRTVKYPMMRKSKLMRSEGNIVSPVGGHQIVTSNHPQAVPESRWGSVTPSFMRPGTAPMTHSFMRPRPAPMTHSFNRPRPAPMTHSFMRPRPAPMTHSFMRPGTAPLTPSFMRPGTGSVDHHSMRLW